MEGPSGGQPQLPGQADAVLCSCQTFNLPTPELLQGMHLYFLFHIMADWDLVSVKNTFHDTISEKNYVHTYTYIYTHIHILQTLTSITNTEHFYTYLNKNQQDLLEYFTCRQPEILGGLSAILKHAMCCAPSSPTRGQFNFLISGHQGLLDRNAILWSRQPKMVKWLWRLRRLKSCCRSSSS